jgi:hypothetical protein
VESKALGEPTEIKVFFSDPYEDEFEAARNSLCSSWVDSGISALSVLAHFAEPIERRSLRQIGDDSESIFEAHVACRTPRGNVDALLLTSWHVTDPAKSTRLTYESSAELTMDHTAVAGYLIENGKVTEVFGRDRSAPRRRRHYEALYQQLLVQDIPISSAAMSMHLNSLLLDPANSSTEFR